jgi:hypothetical protein
MAGYFLYTLDTDVFSQLTSAPTRQQGDAIAAFVGEEIDGYRDDCDDPQAFRWPADRAALATLIIERLALPDWYSDLSYDDASIWDSVIFSLQDEPGQSIGIDFQCSDYESIYWDCAEIAAKHGATMMAEPQFGSRAFRYFGKPTSKYSIYPMYSLYLPDQTRKLLTQLDSVTAHFEGLPDGEGAPREQFFEGLLPTVRDAVAARRVLWVQTDT